MVNIIIWSLLIIPFAILPFKGIPEPTRLIKEALFDLAMMGIIFMSIRNGLRVEYKNKYLGWLFGWGIFHFIWNWYYPQVGGLGFNAGTINECVHFLLASMATILFCSSVEKEGFVRISKAIVIASTAMAVFAICQGIGLDPMKHLATYVSRETRHIAATMDHPDLLGNFLAVCIPFCLYLRGVRYKLCLGLLLIALLMVKSSLSIVAVVVGLSVYLLLRYRDKISYAVIGTGLIGFSIFCFQNKNFSKIENGFTGRVSAWMEFIKRDVNPLFGNGLGVSKAYQVEIGGNIWTTPHNDYLMIWLSLGVVGILLFSLLIINSIKNFNYNQGNTLGFAYLASLMTFLILMLGSFPMESAPIALIGLVSFWAVERSGSWKSN